MYRYIYTYVHISDSVLIEERKRQWINTCKRTNTQMIKPIHMHTCICIYIQHVYMIVYVYMYGIYVYMYICSDGMSLYPHIYNTCMCIYVSLGAPGGVRPPPGGQSLRPLAVVGGQDGRDGGDLNLPGTPKGSKGYPMGP